MNTKLAISNYQKHLHELTAFCNQKVLVTRACNCAKRVLSNFENSQKEDIGPRNAIQAGYDWTNDKVTISQARKFALASHASARLVADSPSACFAARSAGHAAATAHVATHAIHAAIYALKSIGAEGGDIEKEFVWQSEQLK